MATQLKETVKSIALKIAPRASMEILSFRSQRFIIRRERETGRLTTSLAYVETHGSTVRHGVFRGMRYPKSTCQERNLVPKLIGSYEDEIAPWIILAVAREYQQIVNIGSADGYYTVGLALSCPNVKVLAFDTDHWARKATRALAEENRVANVTCHSLCTIAWLRNHLKAGAFLLSDCEGGEAVLLDPQAAPSLLKADILVELHESQAPGIEKLLRSRFFKTHEITSVASRTKDPDRYPDLISIPPNMRNAVISEGRHGPQVWLLMTRKA